MSGVERMILPKGAMVMRVSIKVLVTVGDLEAVARIYLAQGKVPTRRKMLNAVVRIINDVGTDGLVRFYKRYNGFALHAHRLVLALFPEFQRASFPSVN